MKNGIEFYDSRDYDRVIGVLYKNGEIKNINFFQGGFDAETIGSLTEVLLESTNIHLMEIFIRMRNKKYDMTFDKLLESACELYCEAFIYQLDF